MKIIGKILLALIVVLLAFDSAMMLIRLPKTFIITILSSIKWFGEKIKTLYLYILTLQNI